MVTQQNRQQQLTISLPTGPLGVPIQSRKQTNDADGSGLCVVSAKSNPSTITTTTPLEVGDIIISLNGIKLSEVQGGMNAWVKLFQVFGTGERNLIVQRDTISSIASKSSHNALALKDSTKHNSLKKQKLEGAKGKTTTAALGKDMDTSWMDRRVPLFGKSKSETIRSSNKNDGENIIDSTSSKSNIEIISLLDDSDEEDYAPSYSNVASTTELDIMEVSTSLSTSASMWRQASSLSTSGTSSEPRGKLKDDRNYDTHNTTKAPEEDDDEELAIVGTKGQNALVDFPHSRANCVSHQFATGDKKLHCDNCYCYVCDIPATDCKSWVSHCEASHDVPHWRAERARAKRQAREPATASSSSASRTAVVVSGSSSTAFPTPLAPNSNARVTEYSVRSLLQRVTTVHPVEMTPPAGGAFRTTLRHYQKQSLAFMVDTERSLHRGGWLCDEVGMGKSAVILSLVATNPRNPKSITAKNKIDEIVNAIDTNEQKRQSIRQAYYDKEDSAEQDHEDQIALTESKDKKYKLRNAHSILLDTLYDEMNDELSEIARAKKVKLKTTVVLTSLSLLGQWEDEAKKHAPGLVVKTFHSSRKKNSRSISLYNRHDIERLSEVDVIISTSTFSWPHQITKYCEFHRVTQDEAHLFKGSISANVHKANELSSKHRWGVTATPMSNSATDLKKQLKFIQGSAPFSSVKLLTIAIARFNSNPKEAIFNELVDLLKTFMVRHTKNQQINGNEALALPPATTSTIMLRMSQEEDLAFNFINTLPSTFSKHLREGAKTFTTQKSFLPQTSKVLNQGNPKQLMEVYALEKRYNPERLTKIVALRNDLAEHRRSEPNLRAVVFTQFVDIHAACVRGLEKDGFEVYEFTGSSNSVKRDTAIRSFQNIVSRRPAVFVITLRSGNVGITLTAASRVYLLEPCLDPAVEVQAAGRIHRLGQNKPCHVVKLVFKNSYEANIIKLHKQILEGKVSIVDGHVPPGAMRILAEGIRFRPSLDIDQSE